MKRVRAERLNSEYRREIQAILSNRIKDAELTEMVSVTRADVAEDLKTAKVYVSVFSTDPEKRAATFCAVERSAGLVRRELAAVMRTRTVPEIRFLEDDTEERGARIDRLLEEIGRKDS